MYHELFWRGFIPLTNVRQPKTKDTRSTEKEAANVLVSFINKTLGIKSDRVVDTL